jgi:flagellar motor switch protein FliM
MTLGEVMNLEVGQTILFNKTPKDDVILKCGEVPMVSGAIGRSGQHVAVQVRHTAERLQIQEDH